jgi:ADP-ribose pyrophosphatase YjhB (NUDIX family)
MPSAQELYQIADELRAMAAMGLRFSKDPYDLARYKQLLLVSARLIADLEESTPETIVRQYEGILEQVSPRLGADAAVFREGKILLIRRSDNGLWCMPGGQVDVGESLSEASRRELWEETGLRGKVIKLLAILDSRFWLSTSKFHMYYTTFLIEIDPADQPQTTHEATEVGFFSEENLPPLFSSHRARVPLMFRLMRGELPVPQFDFPVETSSYYYREEISE